MLQAITPETRVMFVANPNNPTGTVAPKKLILQLAEAVPDSVLLVMDEAYLDFIEDPADL